MTNKEKFLALASKEVTLTLESNSLRIKNREWLRESQDIAFKVLEKLDALGWTQVDLAKKLGVSPQQVNKIVKGKENLTTSTLKSLQKLLDIPIFASYYENEAKQQEAKSIFALKNIRSEYTTTNFTNGVYNVQKTINKQTNNYSNEYAYQKVL